MVNFKNYRVQIEREIIECAVFNLEKDSLKQEDLPAIGTFVLENIDKVNNYYEMTHFLETLSSKWHIFSTIEAVERGKITEQQDDEATEGVLTLLKHGKIDHALSLAKNITNK